MKLQRIVMAGLGLIIVAGLLRLGVAQFLKRRPVAAPTTVGTPNAALQEPSPTPPPATDYATVKTQVESAVQGQPKSYDLRIRASEFYMRAGDNEAALPHLEAAVRLSPKQFLGWLALGDCAMLVGKPARAEVAYAQAEALQPRHPLVFRGRGQLLVSQQRLPEARRVLEAGMKINPADPEIRTALGNLYLILSKPRLAVEALKPAVDVAPERADLHFLLGDAYGRSLSVEKAIQEMRKATELDPGMDEAWGRLGLYLNNLTRYQEARPALERAVALQPNNPHYHWALGNTYALAGTDPENYRRGVELYEQALKLDSMNPNTLYSYSLALTRHGSPADLQKAVTLLQRLLKTGAFSSNAEYKLAETLRRLGKGQEAEVHFARFQKLSEKGQRENVNLSQSAAFVDTPQAHVKLGQDYLRAGKWDLATKEFTLALERNPALDEAREGLAAAKKHSQGTPRMDRQGHLR